jgi:hypothetical protein
MGEVLGINNGLVCRRSSPADNGNTVGRLF